MAKNELDYGYLATLVEHAQGGDSNAFAELYAATYPEQFRFAMFMLKDDFQAKQALQDTYVFALKNITRLHDPGFFPAWLTQANLRMCFRLQHRDGLCASQDERAADPENRSISIEGQTYAVRAVMTLPYTEAQVLLLKYLCGLKKRDISPLMGLRRGEINRLTQSGLEHLRAFQGPSTEATHK